MVNSARIAATRSHSCARSRSRCVNFTGALANGARTIAVMMLSPSGSRREISAGSGRNSETRRQFASRKHGNEAILMVLSAAAANSPRRNNWRWRHPVPLETRRLVLGNKSMSLARHGEVMLMLRVLFPQPQLPSSNPLAHKELPKRTASFPPCPQCKWLRVSAPFRKCPPANGHSASPPGSPIGAARRTSPPGDARACGRCLAGDRRPGPGKPGRRETVRRSRRCPQRVSRGGRKSRRWESFLPGRGRGACGCPSRGHRR